MACIERRPRCSNVSSEAVPEPLKQIGSVLATLSAIVGAVTTANKILGFLGGAGALGGGLTAGFLGAVATLVVIGTYLVGRCNPTEGLSECIAGVVQNIVQDFNSVLDELLPFTAMHDRADVVVKSRYWDVVEDNGAFTHCTEEEIPRRSEILRCYYFTERVCHAARGAFIGGSVGAVGGIVAGAFIAAAIGCATIIFCIIALAVAAIVAAAAVLAGAAVGGQIGKGAADTPSDDSGTDIATGDLITVNGNLLPRDHDNGANVMWWVESSSLSGRAPASVPSNPFSYCDIDEVFATDACPIVVPPIL